MALTRGEWVMIIGGCLAGLLLIGSGGYMWYEDEKATPYLPTVQAAAKQYGLDPNMLAMQIQTESDWDPTAQSGAGAMGIAQFEPATAAQYGLTVTANPGSNPPTPGSVWDPTASIYAMAAMMADLVSQFGDYATALAAYNWGAGNVTNAINTYGADFFANAPTETQNYITDIMGSSAPASLTT